MNTSRVWVACQSMALWLVRTLLCLLVSSVTALVIATVCRQGGPYISPYAIAAAQQPLAWGLAAGLAVVGVVLLLQNRAPLWLRGLPITVSLTLMLLAGGTVSV